MRCVLITNESHPEIKFDVFERLNTNTVPLNAQELRNCIYRGSLNTYLKDAVAYKPWLSILGKKQPEEIEGFRKRLRGTSAHLFKAKDRDFLGAYHIVVKHSGKALDVERYSTDNCANVFQHDLHGNDNQVWIFVKAEDGFQYIFAKHSGKCLDVEGSKQDNGANVWQYSFHGGHNQQWKLTETEDGWLHILARHSGKALDVQESALHNGANVFQYSLHGGDNQRWKLRPA